MISKRDSLLVVFSAVILGVLVYVPVISYFPPFTGCIGLQCPAFPAPHVNSITLQFFNFGGQVVSYSQFTSYVLCNAGTCGLVLFDGVFYTILVALMAIEVGLVARFLSNRSGIRGASAQIGLGSLALLSPLLPLNPVLVIEEVFVAGVVLILSGLVELWWFRGTERFSDHNLKAEEQLLTE